MLLTLLESQFFPLNPQISDSRTKEHYRRTVDHFNRVLGRRSAVADFSDDNVLRVMSDCLAHGLSAVTANHRRKCLCRLWSWCARRGMIAIWPSVRKLREAKRAPRAWTEGQLHQIIDSCMQCRGDIGGIPSANWWLALHAVLWDTGARITEVLSLRWAWLDFENGLLHVPAVVRKGQTTDKLYQLMDDTLRALRLIQRPGREFIFAGLGHRSALWKRYRVILRRANLPTDRYSMPQKMRRSHASHLKKAGGDPTSSLGHSSDNVTRASYLDESLICEAPAARLFRILPPRDQEKRGD